MGITRSEAWDTGCRKEEKEVFARMRERERERERARETQFCQERGRKKAASAREKEIMIYYRQSRGMRRGKGERNNLSLTYCTHSKCTFFVAQ